MRFFLKKRFLIFVLLLLKPSVVFAGPSFWDICRKLFHFGIFQTVDSLKDRENELTEAVGINEVSSEGLEQKTAAEIETKSVNTIKQERQALENEYIRQLNQAKGLIIVGSRRILPEKLKKLKESYAAALEEEAALQPDIEITEESLARFISPEEKTMSWREVREKYSSNMFAHLYQMSYSLHIRRNFSPFQSQLFRINGKLQYVIKNSNGAKLYHGSISTSLLAFTATQSKGGLRGLYELKNLPSGSAKTSWDEKDKINRSIPNSFHLSTVKITDLGVTVNYSEAGHFREKFIPSGIEFSKRDLDLINDMFPVIYGLKPKVGRRVNITEPDVTLRGEGFSVDVQMVGGADFDEIVAVFVPANKARLVEEIIADLNLPHTIQVSPIEPIQEVFEKNWMPYMTDQSEISIPVRPEFLGCLFCLPPEDRTPEKSGNPGKTLKIQTESV